MVADTGRLGPVEYIGPPAQYHAIFNQMFYSHNDAARLACLLTNAA